MARTDSTLVTRGVELMRQERKKPGPKPRPAGESKTARVELRVKPATKEEWQARAEAAGMTLQAWIEARCR